LGRGPGDTLDNELKGGAAVTRNGGGMHSNEKKYWFGVKMVRVVIRRSQRVERSNIQPPNKKGCSKDFGQKKNGCSKTKEKGGEQ